MSGVGDLFTKRFGPPSPAVSSRVSFPSGSSLEATWEFISDVEAGWYMNRFLYLFGDDLNPLKACLEAWEFLAGKPSGERMILGRNAYGAIVFMDDAEKSANAAVKILDPLSVTVWEEPDSSLIRFLGGALPQNRTRRFLDDSVYKEHLAKTSLYLELDLVLGINTPIGLGGKMSLDNFHVENLLKYYEGTAPIYKKALAGGSSSKKAASELTKAKATVAKRAAAVKTVAKTKKPSPKKR